MFSLRNDTLLSTMPARLVLFSVFLVAAGHHELPAQTIDAGRGPVSITVPKEYDKEKPVPLVVLLHGYTSSGQGQDRYMKFGALAHTYGYLFIAPNGTKEKSRAGHRFWNATNACCDFYKSEVDDSKYLRDLIGAAGKNYSVDPNRIYLIGHSNGGFMAHRMAMDHPDLIAGIAALNGAAPMNLAGPKPKCPVSILHIHGTKDELNRYEGGGDINGFPYPGAEETVKKWAEFYGAPTKPTAAGKKLDLDKKLDGNETTITQYGNGGIELWTINDGGHVPTFNESFNKLVIAWLLAHPKVVKEKQGSVNERSRAGGARRKPVRGGAGAAVCYEESCKYVVLTPFLWAAKSVPQRSEHSALIAVPFTLLCFVMFGRTLFRFNGNR